MAQQSANGSLALEGSGASEGWSVFANSEPDGDDAADDLFACDSAKRAAVPRVPEIVAEDIIGVWTEDGAVIRNWLTGACSETLHECIVVVGERYNVSGAHLALLPNIDLIADDERRFHTVTRDCERLDHVRAQGAAAGGRKHAKGDEADDECSWPLRGIAARAAVGDHDHDNAHWQDDAGQPRNKNGCVEDCDNQQCENCAVPRDHRDASGVLAGIEKAGA